MQYFSNENTILFILNNSKESNDIFEFVNGITHKILLVLKKCQCETNRKFYEDHS